MGAFGKYPALGYGVAKMKIRDEPLFNHAPAFYRARWLAKVTRRV